MTEIFTHLKQKDRALATNIELHQLTDINRLQLQEVLATAAAWQQEAKQLNIPFIQKKKGQLSGSLKIGL